MEDPLMKLLPTSLYTTVKTFFQPRAKRNRETLEFLRSKGWPMPRIRRALLDLNGLTSCELAAQAGISPGTLSNTLRGRRPNESARLACARALGLSISELFPPCATFNPNPSPAANQPPQTGEGPFSCSGTTLDGRV